jgi:hypothetical protein
MHVEERSDPFVLAVRIVRVAYKTNWALVFGELRVVDNAMEVSVELQLLETPGLIHD